MYNLCKLRTNKNNGSNMKKQLITTVVAMLLAFQCAVPAFATESATTSKEQTTITTVIPQFSDVPEDSIWYDGIMTGVERGIVKGCRNGKFNPDREITSYELAVMLCRAFAEEFPTEDPIIYCVKRGWFSTSFAIDGQKMKVESSVFYADLFSAAGIHLYDAQLYADAQKDVPNSIRVAKEFGICDGKTPAGSLITRGAAVSKIVAMQNNEQTQRPPDIYQQMTVVEEMPGAHSKGMLNVYDIPQNILIRFNELHWKIEFGAQAIDAYNQKYGTSGIAMTNYDRKTIYIADDASVAHEFGHFLDFITPDSDTVMPILFAMEAENAEKLLGSYSQTTRQEYFAEVFEYWVMNHDNEEKMALLKKRAPQTYEYMKKLEDAGWTKVSSSFPTVQPTTQEKTA